MYSDVVLEPLMALENTQSISLYFIIEQKVERTLPCLLNMFKSVTVYQILGFASLGTKTFRFYKYFNAASPHIKG